MTIIPNSYTARNGGNPTGRISRKSKQESDNQSGQTNPNDIIAFRVNRFSSIPSNVTIVRKGFLKTTVIVPKYLFCADFMPLRTTTIIQKKDFTYTLQNIKTDGSDSLELNTDVQINFSVSNSEKFFETFLSSGKMSTITTAYSDLKPFYESLNSIIIETLRQCTFEQAKDTRFMDIIDDTHPLYDVDQNLIGNLLDLENNYGISVKGLKFVNLRESAEKQAAQQEASVAAIKRDTDLANATSKAQIRQIEDDAARASNQVEIDKKKALLAIKNDADRVASQIQVDQKYEETRNRLEAIKTFLGEIGSEEISNEQLAEIISAIALLDNDKASIYTTIGERGVGGNIEQLLTTLMQHQNSTDETLGEIKKALQQFNTGNGGKGRN